MAFEKRWAAVPSQNFTADGLSNGQITIANAALFKVKQQVVVVSDTQTNLNLQIQRVIDATTLYVGPINSNINTFTDVSAYKTVDNANVYAIEQPRSSVPEEQIERLTYEEEPTVARRAVLVDKLGNKIDSVTDSSGKNRLAVDGQFTASVDVQVDVDIDGYYDPTTNPDPDNIAIIGHERSLSTSQLQQTQRITAKRGTVDLDTVSQDVSIHDQNGNAYTATNPLPVTNSSYEKFFELIAASRWMNLGNYDQVTPLFSGNNLTLTYMEGASILGEALITNFASSNWNIILNRYIDDDDGTPLQDDDGTFLNLD